MCFVFIFVMRLVRKFLMLPLLLVDHILSSFVFFSVVLFVPFTRSEYYTHLFMLKRLNEKAVPSLLWLMSKRLKKTQRKNGKRGGVQVLKTKRSIHTNKYTSGNFFCYTFVPFVYRTLDWHFIQEPHKHSRGNDEARKQVSASEIQSFACMPRDQQLYN